MWEVLLSLFRPLVTDWLLDAVQRWLTGILAGCLLIAMVGCAPNSEAIERTAGKGFDIAQQALVKALQETSTRTAQLQGTMTAVEPGWVVEGYGIFGTGLVYQGKIYIKGASGTLMGATQADQGQAASIKPPAATQPGREVP